MIDEEELADTLQSLWSHRGTPEYQESIKSLHKCHECLSSIETMQGRAYLKPHGYAGDYEIIDKIYTHHKTDLSHLRVWDDFFHRQPATIAVRNRKEYFKKLIGNIGASSNKPIDVLNVASGPCRDIAEYYDTHPSSSVTFNCVEIDPNAIKYAISILGQYHTRVSFINKNIFRYEIDQEYDLIWSAGLFDYFDDKTFVRILARFINSCPETKIVIGNFSDENPTSAYMEVFGEWILNQRGPSKLQALAIEAGANINDISIQSEPAGVNLFLHIN